MGYIRHDAIIVTTSSHDREVLEESRSAARRFGLLVSEVIFTVNGYVSFFIPPDGSKEGWDASDLADRARHGWKQWVKEHPNGDRLDWAHVSFGGDDAELARMVDHNEDEE